MTNNKTLHRTSSPERWAGMKYLVRIETYLTGVRTVAEFDTLEEAENFLNNYHFKQSKIVRENEVSGWIERKVK